MKEYMHSKDLILGLSVDCSKHRRSIAFPFIEIHHPTIWKGELFLNLVCLPMVLGSYCWDIAPIRG